MHAQVFMYMDSFNKNFKLMQIEHEKLNNYNSGMNFSLLSKSLKIKKITFDFVPSY